MLFAGNAEQAAVGLDTNLPFPCRECGVGLGASYEDDIVTAEFVVRDIKILPNRYRAFERIQIMLLKLFGRVSIRSRVSYGPIDDDRGGKMPENIGGQIDSAAGVLGQLRLCARGIQEQ